MPDELSVKEKELLVKIEELNNKIDEQRKLHEAEVGKLTSDKKELERINQSYYNKIMVQNEQTEDNTFGKDVKPFDEFVVDLSKGMKEKI